MENLEVNHNVFLPGHGGNNTIDFEVWNQKSIVSDPGKGALVSSFELMSTPLWLPSSPTLPSAAGEWDVPLRAWVFPLDHFLNSRTIELPA